MTENITEHKRNMRSKGRENDNTQCGMWLSLIFKIPACQVSGDNHSQTLLGVFSPG